MTTKVPIEKSDMIMTLWDLSKNALPTVPPRRETGL